MRGDNIRIVVVGVLVVMMLLFHCPAFLHRDEWYIAFAHHFFHANIFHLSVNCLSIWAVFRKDMTYNLSSLLIPFACATISWFFSSADPVGVSNFLFAIVGLRTPSFKSAWWKMSSARVFLITMVAMIFVPNVSAVTHIVSFVLGCICACLGRRVNKLKNDFRRATYHR